MRSFALLFFASLLAFEASCSRKTQAKNMPLPSSPKPMINVPVGYTETGIASWYGEPYHGRRAANGEVFDMHQLTAAHKTLPFGTWVSVQNLINSRKVEVRITDRGPFVDGRIIDLSRKAAQEISLIGPGISRVRLTVIPPPKGQTIERYGVQVASLTDDKKATTIQNELRKKGINAQVLPRDGNFRVIAPAGTEPEARILASRIRSLGHRPLVVRLEDPSRPSPIAVGSTQ